MRKFLLILFLLSLYAVNSYADRKVSGEGDGFSLYTFKEENQQLDIPHIRFMAAAGGRRANAYRKLYDRIVDETNFTYLYFRLSIDESDKPLYIPKGEGNFILITLDGEYPDKGVFVWQRSDLQVLDSIDKHLFIRSNKMTLNKYDEVRMLIRFAAGIKLDRMIEIFPTECVKIIRR